MGIKRESGDVRTFKSSQAVCMSYNGISPEGGPSGNDALLKAAGAGAIHATADAGDTNAQVLGDLPMYTLVKRITNLTALSSGTISIQLPAFGGEAEHTFVAAGALNAAGEFTITPLLGKGSPISRPIIVTVTSGTADEEVLLDIEVQPIGVDWK